MVELHQSYGIREFSFEDDTFVTFKARLKDICEQLIDLNLGISWSCLGRVNHVTLENLRLMRQAGCWQISFGIESGSAEILTLINKRVTLDQVRQAVSPEPGSRNPDQGVLYPRSSGRDARNLGYDQQLCPGTTPRRYQRQPDDALSGHGTLRAGRGIRGI